MRSPRPALATAVAAVLLIAAAPAAPSETSADRSSLHTLALAGATLDPVADLAPTDPAGHDLVLVQFDERGATAIVDALPDTGAALVQPLGPVSYLVWADAPTTQRIRGMDGVRFAGVLPGDARIAPSAAGATTFRVTVVGDSPLAVLATATTPRRFTGTTGAVLRLPAHLVDLADLAARPEVYSVAGADDLIGPAALRDERTAAIVSQGDATPDGRYAPSEQLGADGSGVTVAVVDGGIDTNHPELTDRGITCTDYTPAGLGCLTGNADDAIGHGTHVAGIVLGDGSTGIGDGAVGGYRFGMGVAPGADLHVQNAINLAADRPSITELFRTSFRADASVVQNSWGPSSEPQGYDEPTRQADAAVRDADPDTPGDQPLGVVFSIMNGSGGTSTQGAPDEAKNILAVGGSGSGRPGSPGGDDLCTCSAHGPNLDGSRLVDVVAPGEGVMSTRAAQGTLCGVPSQEFPSPLHATCTGTSMASPHVSGAYALIVQTHRDLHGTDPSPALVRAAIVNGATDLARGGRRGLDADGRRLTPVPNEQQGWGRLDVGRTLRGLRAADALHLDQTHAFTATDESYTTTVDVAGGAPLRITLAWTDAFGHGLGGALVSLVNDLDLVVTAPDGTVHLGNVFADGRSISGGGADRLNNLENVWLDAATPGTWTIEVRAAAIVGDGVPSLTGPTDQDFALVVTQG